MSESLEGFSVAAKRKNAGRSGNACAAAGSAAAPPARVGGVNGPGPTVCASVIVAWGSVSNAKLSHDWAAVASSSPLIADAARAPATTTAVIKTCIMESPVLSKPDFLAMRRGHGRDALCAKPVERAAYAQHQAPGRVRTVSSKVFS